MILIGDSAWPLKQYPKTWNGQPIRGWAVYVGGDTPHPWTDAEIVALKLVPWFEFIVPIWVRSNPTGSAQAQQDAAAQLAWSRAHGQPAQTVIELDFETAVEGAYAMTFDADLQRGAELEMLYGSAATVTGNPAPSDGYNEADWTGVEPTSLPLGVVGEQFYSQTYDLTAYAEAAHLWSFRSQTTPAPSAPRSTQEDEMAQAIDGQVDIGWSVGDMAVVQVSANGGSPLNKGQTPELSVCLHTRGGAVWLAGAGGIAPWEPTEANPVLRFDEHKANAFGITVAALNANGAGTRYAAIVAP